jgi:hypothetical protein
VDSWYIDIKEGCNISVDNNYTNNINNNIFCEEINTSSPIMHNLLTNKNISQYSHTHHKKLLYHLIILL